MDIWRWVTGTIERLGEGDAPRRRLSELMSELPSLVTDDQHARADAAGAEATALARSLDQPWVEVFVRHWLLQSRVFDRAEATSALPEAIDLVERAHRDDARDCPQSVCTIQDLGACYGWVDGPGYAEERLAVSQEALDRIDPSWPCFECISGEYAEALVDAGRSADAIVFLNRQLAARMREGTAVRKETFCAMTRLGALVRRGQDREALALLDAADRRTDDGAHERMRRRLWRAFLRARAGEPEAAAKGMPAARAIDPTPGLYRLWIDVVALLVPTGAWPNDYELGATLARWLRRLERQGVQRISLEIAGIHGKLAVDRGALHVARRALATMERLLPQLRAPFDAPDHIRALREVIAAAPLPVVTLPDTVAALLAEEGLPDPEVQVTRLLAAAARWPGEGAVVQALGEALGASGALEDAVEVLRAHAAAHPDDPEAWAIYGHQLRAAGERAGVVEVAGRLDALGESALAAWLRATDAFDAGEDDACVRLLEPLVAADPAAMNARRLLARVARRRGDWATALRALEEVVAAQPKAADDWELLVPAAVLGRSDVEAAAVARLGFDLDEDTWAGRCRVRLDDGEHWALRIGPVTARVARIAAPDEEQHFGDILVFDPKPIEGGEVPLLQGVHVVSEGGFECFHVDGVFPGEAAWAELVARVEAVGGAVHVRSNAEYRTTDPDTGEVHDGVFAYLALPPEADRGEVHRSLLVWRAGVAGPIVWIGLANAARDEATSDAFLTLAVRWNFD